MVFPTITDTDSTLCGSTNNQQNITISRSSSNETEIIKEYETTTISHCTNEVTISRIVGKPDVLDRIAATDDTEETGQKDLINGTISYTNNVIKIHSNVEIRNADSLHDKPVPILVSYADSVIRDTSNVVTSNDVDKLHVPDDLAKAPAIMSQKSLDFVVDSLTSDDINKVTDKSKDVTLIRTLRKNFRNKFHKKPQTSNSTKSCVKVPERNIFKAYKKDTSNPPSRKEENEDLDKTKIYEAIIKLPTGKCIVLKGAEEETDNSALIKINTKEMLKQVLNEKKFEKVKEPSQLSPNVCRKLTPSITLQSNYNVVPLMMKPISPYISVAQRNTQAKVAIPAWLTTISTLNSNLNLNKNTDAKVATSKNEVKNKNVYTKIIESNEKKNTSLNLNKDCIIINDSEDDSGSGTKISSSLYAKEGRKAASKRYR